MTLLTKKEKQELVEKFKRSEGDTGSSEVQIAILTKKINVRYYGTYFYQIILYQNTIHFYTLKFICKHTIFF